MPDRKAPPIPPIPERYVAPASAPVRINPSIPRRSIRRTPPSPTKSAKSDKGSRWGKWSMRVKTAFRFKRHKRPPVVDLRKPAVPVMDIGKPSGFQHHFTYGEKGLRTSDGLFVPPAEETPTPAGARGTIVLAGASLGGGDLGQGPSTSHVRDKGTAGAGNNGGDNLYLGLGHQDADGTAVSDDGDSDWEDDEV
ncbi:hypothetical protein E8E12_010823 [Didymella heteroderae]|uniref:Uncharacterized protein n=1 Tax=Didymella heteroderae TaxID=1769908 RepID=A0A9P4WXJ4_9PLEO|nr:hypothetical protein E8E12_010823 [Didymella heteroderae]